MKNRGLGKGLASLLSENISHSREGDDNFSNLELDITLLKPGKYQPRRTFDTESLEELADSIKRSGIIQPLIVSKLSDDTYGIIAGERRWRAARIAGIQTVPVIIKDLAEDKILEIALVENIQREDLNAMEEAEGYSRLVEEFGYTQDKIAQMIGKSRSHVANMLRLNTLPSIIKNEIVDGNLTMGHARSLVGHNMAEQIARIVIGKALNVRQTEELVKNWDKKNAPVSKRENANRHSNNDDDLQSLVDTLSDNFGMKITIENASHGGGKVIFHFSSMEQLDSILAKLT